MLHFLWKRIYREVILLFAFFLPAERKRRLERWLRGKEEFRKLELADVVVVSFGKSGRTWLRVLLSRFFQLRFGLRPSAFIGFDNLNRRDKGIPRVFFTHDNYLRDYTGNLDSKRDFYGKKVILLVRQPEDVAVSQYHQWKFRMRPRKKGLNQYPEHGKDVPIFEFAMDENAGLPKVIEFMNGWARELPNLKQLLIVRYEDLRHDTAGQLRRVLEFMGQTPTDAELQDCVQFASVENMRKLEEKRVFWLAGSRMKPGDRSNPDSFKVRRAKVGGYRDYFDEAQIRALDAMVEERLLPGFGYLASEKPPVPTAASA
ncbi:sulfotransferase domain-containing protein [Benzoatithermus flavus]|uniref:Sulfotransferase domain-containing protein n=1 Tax=Benzoatithermus flavus TaxID=3108223 RepID=A0ABU8XQN6_9PROT